MENVIISGSDQASSNNQDIRKLDYENHLNTLMRIGFDYNDAYLGETAVNTIFKVSKNQDT